MVWLTPAMDRLFIEGASGRRKFLDRLVLGFDAGHARRAARYETAMRERLRLLQNSARAIPTGSTASRRHGGNRRRHGAGARRDGRKG